jgi:hypothetical protein
MLELVEDAVVFFLVLVICVLSVYAVLEFLHGGPRGLGEDLRLAAGFPQSESVDTIRVSEADIETLKSGYSGERERMWAADINESGFLQGLELIGEGNYSRVEARDLGDWRPDVLIHSHPVQGSARLSRLDKVMLLNRSDQVLSAGLGRGDVFSVSCILHRKWRFVSEPGLYCYGNPFYYRTEWGRESREEFIEEAGSRDVEFDRVEVVEIG